MEYLAYAGMQIQLKMGYLVQAAPARGRVVANMESTCDSLVCNKISLADPIARIRYGVCSPTHSESGINNCDVNTAQS